MDMCMYMLCVRVVGRGGAGFAFWKPDSHRDSRLRELSINLLKELTLLQSFLCAAAAMTIATVPAVGPEAPIEACGGRTLHVQIVSDTVVSLCTHKTSRAADANAPRIECDLFTAVTAWLDWQRKFAASAA